jgi:1,4-dihydroxy-2-naphthoate polyprenyltransferase
VSTGQHHFASTSPLLPGQQALPEQHMPRSRAWLFRFIELPPRTIAGAFFRLTRADAALALVMPTLCGAMLGWWHSGHFNGLTFAFTLASVLASLLGVNTLAEYYDYKTARRADALAENEPLFSGFGLLAQGYVRPEIALNLGHILLAIGGICGLWLILLAGWPVLFFAGFSLLLAYTYAIPPVQYGYRGWALGEIGVFCGYGLLQLLGSYFVQAQTLTWLPLWVGLPFGLLATLTIFNYNIIYERRDWLMRKRTLAVSLGPLRAVDASVALTLGAYIAVLLIASLAHLPLGVLVVLVALPRAMSEFAQMQRDPLAVEDGVALYRATTHATLLSGLLFCLALLLDKLW